MCDSIANGGQRVVASSTPNFTNIYVSNSVTASNLFGNLSYLANNGNYMRLLADGSFTFPNNRIDVGTNSLTIATQSGFTWDWNDGSGSLSEVNINSGGINFDVATPSLTSRWYFNQDGSTVLPANLYAANAVTTTNVIVNGTLGVDGAMTSNAANTTFFYDTFTIPYINTQVLNVAAIVSLSNANVTTLNVQSLFANTLTVYGANTLNVLGISNLNSLVTPTANVRILNVSTISNLNSLTTNLTATTANVGSLNVSTISNLNSLALGGNLYASNALTTINLFANTMTLANASAVITGNLYISNALTTNNIVATGFTSNSTNTVFNFDTLTIPFINSTTLNVSSTSNLQVATLTGSTGAPTVYLTGNLYASNAVTATNIFATSVLGTVYGPVLGSNVGAFLNLYSSNALTTTNVVCTSLNVTNQLGFKNRIINGDFIIDQRNAGASSTPSTGLTRVIDRWKTEIAGSGRCLVGQNLGAIASPSGLTSYFGMRVSTTTTFGAGDYFFLSQVIEGINVVDLAWGTASARPVTLSFWVYSSLTGTAGGFIRNAGETAGNYTRSYPFTYTISATNTWEQKSVTITADTAGQWISGQLDGPEVGFSVWNGSNFQGAPGAWGGANYTGPTGTLINWAGTLNSNLYLAGVQFETGSVATPFERRHLGFELAQCQRYFEPSIVRVGGYHTAGNFLRGSVYFNTKKRPKTSPTFSIGTQYENNNLGVLNFDSSNFDQSSARWLSNVVTTGDAYGQWKVTVDCEF